MKTITKLIVPGRSAHYLWGMLVFLISTAAPIQSFSQCLEAAQSACDDETAITVQLTEDNALVVRVNSEFYNGNLPASCDADNFMITVTDLSSDPDTLVADVNPNDPFRNNNACQYVGKRLQATLNYLDGDNMIPVCDRPLYVLPYIECYDTTLYCHEEVFENSMDETILPIRLGCEDFDPNVEAEIINAYFNNNTSMDTLFRTWEVSINNGKGVTTCTDTILREAIPNAILFPSNDTIACELWDGNAPAPSQSGYPYFIDDESGDTIYLDPGEVQHCVSVSYSDEAWGSLGCEVEKYIRSWKIRTAEFVAEGEQEITILDMNGPSGEFRFKATDSIDFVTQEDDSLRLPVYQISTGQHDCTSDGTLPILYASDACSDVAKVEVVITVDGIDQVLSNGGPMMGFDEGKYIARYTAYDECWNDSTFYVAIQVTDQVNPTAVFGTDYNITMTGYEITWLDVEDFVANKVSDNCEVEMVVARRMDDHAVACGANDSLSVLGMYREKYRQWLEDDGWVCADMIDPNEGWMDKVPFCCSDLGDSVMVEFLIFDGSCNMTRAMTTLIPVDKGSARITEELADVSLACEAWTENYESLIFPNGRDSVPDIDSLNKYFGQYESYIPGGNIEPTGYIIQDQLCEQNLSGALVRTDTSFEIWGGKFLGICSDSLTQEAEFLQDEGCNTFSIVRRFLINGNVIATQTIRTEIRCPFVEELFEYPAKDTMITVADISYVHNDDYWTGNRFNVETEAPEYIGSDCRITTLGYFDKLMDMISSQNPNEADAVIIRTWCMADWCATDLPDDWKTAAGSGGVLMFEQHIKIFEDSDNPDVALEPEPDNVSENDGPDVVVPGNNSDDEEPVTEVPANESTDKTMVDIKGFVRTEDALNVNNVRINVRNNSDEKEMITNESGSFEMEVGMGSAISIEPVKSGSLINGISTLDLILIQRHLLKKKLITSPYKLIAADANNDKRLTPADVLTLRKIILGKETNLAEENAWKFVNSDYNFINTKSAYSEEYPTSVDIWEIDKDLQSDFVAIKLGDINGTVNVTRSSGRSNLETRYLELANKILEPGQEIDIPVQLVDLKDLLGMQLALNYGEDQVEILGVSSDQISISNENLNVQNGIVRISWSDSEAKSLSNEEPVFVIKLRAERTVSLKDVIALNTQSISPEVYDSRENEFALGLSFGAEVKEDAFTLYQNRPNPTNGETIIDFSIENEKSVELVIHDVTGKAVYRSKAHANKGMNQFKVQTHSFSSGVYYYSVSDGKNVATRKMVVIK